MRTLTLVLIPILIFTFLGVNAGAEQTPEETIPLEVKLEWAFGMEEPESNLFRTKNLHALYNTVAHAIRDGFRYKVKAAWLQRTLEIGYSFPLAFYMSIAGHERGGHGETALANGAEDTSPHVFYEGGAYSWEGLPEEGKLKTSAAGMTWTNRSAEEVISRNLLGKEVTVSNLIWFGIGQIDTASYIISKTDEPKREDYIRYGSYGRDTERWIRLLSDEDYERAVHLYGDLRVGGYWQGLGLVPPLLAGLDYWFTGSLHKAPRFWLNPQTELTDAGVMYNLDVYHLLIGREILIKGRLGYGRDRVEKEGMYAAELGVSGIPIFWGVKGGLRGGVSETLGPNHSYGLSLSRTFGNFELGVEYDHYNGHHRRNPKAEGDFSEVVFSVGFEL